MGGLSGALIVEGLKQRLPASLRNIVERNLVLKDVQLTTRDRIVFRNIDSAAPTTRTVNGQVNPVMRIGPGETQLVAQGPQQRGVTGKDDEVAVVVVVVVGEDGEGDGEHPELLRRDQPRHHEHP